MGQRSALEEIQQQLASIRERDEWVSGKFTESKNGPDCPVAGWRA
jgi:hypothetical protein